MSSSRHHDVAAAAKKILDAEAIFVTCGAGMGVDRSHFFSYTSHDILTDASSAVAYQIFEEILVSGRPIHP